MSEASEDVLKFVLLVEQHKDVLLKSQMSSNKEKKKAAALSIIVKWEEISKIKLTDASLLKKISNLKTRAKAALNSGKPMIEWQIKILGIGNDDKELDNLNHSTNEICEDASDEIATPPNAETNAENILNKYETVETKLMSNDQLQRFVLLQKVHVLTLQRERLERLNTIDDAKNVAIDFIGFDDDANPNID